MSAAFPVLAVSSSMTFLGKTHSEQEKRPLHLGEPIHSFQSPAPRQAEPMAPAADHVQDVKPTKLVSISGPNTTLPESWKEDEKTAPQAPPADQPAVRAHGSHPLACMDPGDGAGDYRHTPLPSSNCSTQDSKRTPSTAASVNHESGKHIGLDPARFSTAYTAQRRHDAQDCKEQRALRWRHSASMEHSLTERSCNGRSPEERTPCIGNADNAPPTHSASGAQHTANGVIDCTEPCPCSYGEQQDACSGYGTPALYSPLFSSPSSSSALSSAASSLGAPPSTFCSPLSMPLPSATTPGVPLSECSGVSYSERMVAGPSLPLSSTEKLKATFPVLPVCLWSSFPDAITSQIQGHILQTPATKDATNPTPTTTSSLGSVQTTASASPELPSASSHALDIPTVAYPQNPFLHTNKNKSTSNPSPKECSTLATNLSPSPVGCQEAAVAIAVPPTGTEEEAGGSATKGKKSFKTLFSSLLQDPHFSPVVKPWLPAADRDSGNIKHQQPQPDFGNIIKHGCMEASAESLVTGSSPTNRQHTSKSLTECNSNRTAEYQVVLEPPCHVFSPSGVSDGNDELPTMPPQKKRRGSFVSTNIIETPHSSKTCYPFYQEVLPLPVMGGSEGNDVMRPTPSPSSYRKWSDTSVGIISKTDYTQEGTSLRESEDTSYIAPDTLNPDVPPCNNPTIRRIRLSRPVGYAGMRLYSPSTVPLSNGVLQVHRQGPSMGTEEVFPSPTREHASHFRRSSDQHDNLGPTNTLNGPCETVKPRSLRNTPSVQKDFIKLCQAPGPPFHSPLSRRENLQLASADSLGESDAAQKGRAKTMACASNNPHNTLFNGLNASQFPESQLHPIHEEAQSASTMGGSLATTCPSQAPTAYFESPTCKFDRLKRELHVCWRENNQTKVQKFSCKKLGKEIVFKKAQALMLRIACMALQWPSTNAHYAQPGTVRGHHCQTAEATAETQNGRTVAVVRPSSREPFRQDNENTVLLQSHAHMHTLNGAEDYGSSNRNASATACLNCLPVTTKPLEEIIYDYDGPYAPTLTYKKLSREWIVEWTVEGKRRIARWSCKKLGKYEAITRAERFVNLLALGVSDPQIRRSSKRPSAMGAKLFGSCSPCSTPLSHYCLKPHFAADQPAPDGRGLVMSPLAAGYAIATVVGSVPEATSATSTTPPGDGCL